MYRYYYFRNKKTEEEVQLFLSEKELTAYEKKNKQMERIVGGAPLITDGRPLKPDSEFRNLLKHIKKSHKTDNINDF